MGYINLNRGINIMQTWMVMLEDKYLDTVFYRESMEEDEVL